LLPEPQIVGGVKTGSAVRPPFVQKVEGLGTHSPGRVCEIETPGLRPASSWDTTDDKKGALFAQVSSVNRNSKKGAPLPRLTKIVAIQIHHLVPCRHEVLHKHLLRIVASIGFRDGPEVGV